VHTWVSAEPVPRFYPNVVTLTTGEADIVEQRQTVRILLKSHLPGRWAVKDSFNALDIARLGFEPLFEANWIRKGVPKPAAMISGLSWERVQSSGNEAFPQALFSDDNFAMFSGRRSGVVVAGGTLYRSDGVVGLTNVMADPAEARAVWHDMQSLAASTFPGMALVGYESDDELKAAHRAGFEVGDPLRVWVKAKD